MQTTPAQDYARKLAAAHAQAQAAGLKRWDYDTGFDRLLRKLGFRVPPTLYAHSGWVGLWLGLWFAVTWGAFMHFVVWLTPVEVHPMSSIVAGALFGATMALYQRRTRRKHCLTPWSAL